MIFDADPHALPRHLREQFCGTVESIANKKTEVAEVLIDERYHGKRSLAVLKFVASVKPQEALDFARKLKAWFFENLISPVDRREQAQLRKARRRTRIAQQRRGRRQERQKLVFCVRRQMVPVH